jgi:cytochrome P450
MTTAAAEQVVFNPLHPAYRDDPHPFLHRLRANDPIHWSPVYRVWVLTRYADCTAALRDDRLSASARGWENYNRFYNRADSSAPPPSEVYRHWMLQLDDPDHARLRGLVNKAFTPRVVEMMRPRVREIVLELLDARVSVSEFDAVEELSYPLPIRVITEMLGVPTEDYLKVKEWSAALLPSFGPVMSIAQVGQISRVMADFSAYFHSLVELKRKVPADDLLSLLIDAQDQGNRLTTPELVATCILLLFAGHLTTVQLIAGGMLALANHPDQWRILKNSRDLIPGAVEEMLRFVSPLQVVGRTAKIDFELGGKLVRQGQMVFVSFPAANRDPDQFPDPDAFDVTRTPNRHIAFGYAGHFCLGASLARLEAQVVFETLLNRYDHIEVTAPRLERDSTLLLRGLKSLPVHLHPAGGA